MKLELILGTQPELLIIVTTMSHKEPREPNFINVKKRTLAGWNDYVNTIERERAQAREAHQCANNRLYNELRDVLNTMFGDDGTDSQGNKLKADLEKARHCEADLTGKSRELETFATNFLTQYMGYVQANRKRKQPLDLVNM